MATTDDSKDNERGDNQSSNGEWVVLLSGVAGFAAAIVAVFTVTGRDDLVLALLILSACLIFGGAVMPYLNGDFELSAKGLKGKLDRGERAVEEARKNLPLETAGSSEPTAIERQGEREIDDILAAATSSPKVSFIRLAVAVEAEVRKLFAQTGWIPLNSKMSLKAMAAEAQKRNLVPISLTSSLEVFGDIRNSVIHGQGGVSDDEILRAIDIGASIMQMLQGIPHETHVVTHVKVVVFSDAEAATPRDDVTGLIMNSLSPGGTRVDRRIFPTTRDDYLVGDVLAWEWNVERVWNDSWYKDPDTGEILLAWNGAVEFVGTPLRD